MFKLFFAVILYFLAIINSQKVSLNLSNPSLEAIILKIETQADVKFAYAEDVNIKTKVKGAYKFVNIDLKEVIQEISLRTPFTLSIIGDNITIAADPETTKPEVQNDEVQQLVKGVVIDADGIPVLGVSVIEKGTSHGVITNFNGEFSIEVAQGAALEFRYIGYETVELEIGNHTYLEVVLQTSVSELEEVVVVGYGSISKRDITGAVGSVKMDELNSRPFTDFGEALSGKVTGVQVLNASGRPGSSPSIRIRGVNSISAGGAPLIVIDGIQIPGYDLNSLNANDIKSIEVLKDAASASIYGSRGANGVILVTTKSGKGKEPAFHFNYTSSLQQVIRKIGVMNSNEYAQASIDAAQNGWIDQGGDPNAPNTIEARGNFRYTWPDALENPETLADTDWQDVIFRAAPMQQFDIGYSGGNEKSNFYVSGSYTNQEGIVITSAYQKFNLNMNVDTKINDWLSAGAMLNTLYDQDKVPFDRIVEWGVQYPSIYPVYGNDGYIGGPLNTDGFENYSGILFRPNNGNPLYRTNDVIQNENFSGMGNLFVNIEFMKGLNFKSSVNAVLRDGKNSNYASSEHNLGEAARTTANFSVADSRTLSYTLSNMWTYNKTLENHNFNVLAGYEYNHREYYRSTAKRRGYDSDFLHSLSAGQEIVSADDSANETNLISYLSRINYSYLDRYMLAASLRRDGSSRFGPNNKWGNFWSLSGAWRVSEEQFLKSSTVISNLKLKASYGVTGNDNFSDYVWIGRINQARTAIGNNLFTSYFPSNIENPDLEWEGTRQVNLGMDIGLWENKVNLEANIYRSDSDNLLLNVPIPAASGFTSAFSNNGSVMNRGLELSLQTQNLSTNKLSWSTNLIFSLNRSEITKLGRNNASMIFGLPDTYGSVQKINEVGEQAFSFYGYQYDGVYLNQSEIDADPAAPSTATPGSGRYKDIDGDGVINTNDRTIIGNTEPDFSFGITNSFTIGNFDVNLLFRGVVGGELYDDNAHRSLFYHEGRNYLKEVNNRWRSEEEPGDGYHFKLSVNPDGMAKTFSSYWLHSGSYLRLENVTVGFNMPKEIVSNLGISQARIFFNGVNLLLIAKAPVFDPENFIGSVTNAVSRGAGGSVYPSAKILSLGINVKF
ncbi:TonB-dependent receptor [Arenibacter palladensis]|uniref:SusC/RagA family TonB-linked outer membrane protein n=1 Tax=Arenibacter palladensis TaxID=237373 RepID=UPI002FD3CA4A